MFGTPFITTSAPPKREPEALHIVITHGLLGVNDPEATCVRLILAAKDITLNQIAIAVPHGKGSAQFEKCIIPKCTSAGLG